MSRKHRPSAEDWRDSLKTVLREYSESLIIAIFLALIVRFYVVSAYQVPMDSMNPTLVKGDFLFGYKLPFGVPVPFSSIKLGENFPQRGEVIIFRCPPQPSQRCVKRVVGLPGDRIEIRGKRLSINGKWATYKKVGKPRSDEKVELEEERLKTKNTILISSSKEQENFGPYMVPPNHFFVLGDSRDESVDSRSWGPVPMRFLEAKPLFIWLSFDWGHPNSKRALPSVRWSRLFDRVD